MRILLASLGTAGDVHPFLAIGRALAARGHRVELISNPVFAPLAAQAGISLLPVGTAEQFAQTFAHHFIWHAVNGFGVMWRHLARPAIPEAYRHIERVQREEPCVVLYSPFLMPAPRIAQEALGVRAVAAYTAPAMLPNYQPPLCLTWLRVPGWVPRAAAHWAVMRLDRRKMQPLARPAIESLRGELGLPALQASVFQQWVHSPLLGITLFPSWFAAPTADWPAPLLQAGFPLWDGDAETGLEPRLAAFLDDGPPPLVFTAGTAMTQAKALFAQAVDAARSLGERVLLLSADSAQVPANLPAEMMHAPYAPFALVLPRARALIHHGGIGSSAQALRAGVPQLLLPHAYDQFDNAMRLQALGVARSLDARALTAALLAQRLRVLLGDRGIAPSCSAAAARLRVDQAPARIATAIEGLA